MKHQKKIVIACNEINRKIPVATNDKQYSQSYLKRKNTKLIKQLKIITQQSKTKNPSIVDIKSVTKEHPKTSHKLSKTIRQAEKVGCGKNSDSPLYSETKKVKIF